MSLRHLPRSIEATLRQSVNHGSRRASGTYGRNQCGRPVNRMRAVHPGEALREDYLAPLELSVNALSIALDVPATRIHEIVKERRAVTADTAARLVAYFGGDAASWLAMQANYDLKTLPTRQDIERQVLAREVQAALAA